MGWPHHHDLGLWGGRCYIFPKPKRKRLWCGHFSIIGRLVIQGHPIDIEYQNWKCNRQEMCVYNLGSQWHEH